FSSRRRHTRFSRDWSSDVCSSDLFPVGVDPEGLRELAAAGLDSDFARELVASLEGRTPMIGIDRLDYSKGILCRLDGFERFLERSEERRVGKEGSSRGRTVAVSIR